MKARVVKDEPWWYGQVYGTWENHLFHTEWTGWNNVTEHCMTYLGAKIALKIWIHQNCPKEFDI